jgi:hypothetical protein
MTLSRQPEMLVKRQRHLDQAKCILRSDVPDKLVAVEVEFSFLSLVFRMEVFWFVFMKVHPDHGAEKDSDDRHARE